jgi:1,4-alpha-glucan branching enzyme
LIKALAQAKQWNPDIHGIIVGDETVGLDGSYLEELQKTIDQLGMHDHITILPAQQNVSNAMSALDLFVMPSWSEAFGLVALEAMAMGVPCILARGGSAMELAENSGALTFRPRDAYDLALKIKYIYGRSDLAGEMVKTGKAYALAHHGRETRLERTLELYARCYRRRISHGA